MMRWLHIIFASAALLFAGAAAATACEFAFLLDGSDGVQRSITAGSTTDLALGGTYTLTVEFTEDHGNCKLEPEDTVFLLEEEKWKPTKDTLPLLLTGSVIWEQETDRVNIAEISFQAVKEGRWELEIIRDCSKGGYDEVLAFVVTES
jgi:hypothetical protein